MLPSVCGNIFPLYPTHLNRKLSHLGRKISPSLWEFYAIERTGIHNNYLFVEISTYITICTYTHYAFVKYFPSCTVTFSLDILSFLPFFPEMQQVEFQIFSSNKVHTNNFLQKFSSATEENILQSFIQRQVFTQEKYLICINCIEAIIKKKPAHKNCGQDTSPCLYI